MSETKVTFVEAELIKLSLSPGDVLGVKITTDDDIGQANLESLQSQLNSLFPNNKVMVFCLRPDLNIEFTAIQTELDCGPKACLDCDCGKKSKLEALDELTKMSEELGLYNEELGDKK